MPAKPHTRSPTFHLEPGATSATVPAKSQPSASGSIPSCTATPIVGIRQSAGLSAAYSTLTSTGRNSTARAAFVPALGTAWLDETWSLSSGPTSSMVRARMTLGTSDMAADPGCLHGKAAHEETARHAVPLQLT